MSLVNSVGYNEFAYEGKINFGPLKSIDEIVMHEIGLIEDLPVSGMSIYDIRFGIKSKRPIDQFGAGRARFAPEGNPLTLQLNSRSGRIFDIPALAWVPRIVDPDHPDFRMRIKAGHIDIVTARRKSNRKFILNYSLEEKFPFLEQMGLLCLINWTQGGEINFRALTDKGEIFTGTFSEGLKAESWMTQLEVVGHHMIDLLGRDKCKEISLSYIEFAELSRKINAIASIFSSRTFRFEAFFDEQIEPFKKLVGYLYGEIGPWTFGALYEFQHTERSSEGKRQTFYFDNPRIISKFAYKQPLAKTRRQIKKQFDAYCGQQNTPVATLQDGDLIVWTQALEGDLPIALSVD